MSEYGVNVPPGIPVFKVDQVAAAAKKMADDAGEVRRWTCLLRLAGKRQRCWHLHPLQLPGAGAEKEAGPVLQLAFPDGQL